MAVPLSESVLSSHFPSACTTTTICKRIDRELCEGAQASFKCRASDAQTLSDIYP